MNLQGHTPVVVSGCSGGGKSTLLAVLARRGHAVFDEPGRQVVKAELAAGGDGLPWENVERFIALCFALAVEQWDAAARLGGVSFFDSGIVDAVSALASQNLPVTPAYSAALTRCRYHARMFMVPPWREIYTNDDERRHSFADAVMEFERLTQAYAQLGYEVVMVPKAPIKARAAFVLGQLNLPSGA